MVSTGSGDDACNRGAGPELEESARDTAAAGKALVSVWLCGEGDRGEHVPSYQTGKVLETLCLDNQSVIKHRIITSWRS